MGLLFIKRIINLELAPNGYRTWTFKSTPLNSTKEGYSSIKCAKLELIGFSHKTLEKLFNFPKSWIFQKLWRKFRNCIEIMSENISSSKELLTAWDDCKIFFFSLEGHFSKMAKNSSVNLSKSSKVASGSI